MRECDDKEFAACMKVVADIYGKEPFTKEALKMFFMLWQRYSIEQVKQALQLHMAESPFMPKPADIIKRIDGTAEDRAALAWRVVVRAVERLGHYESVRFPTPAYHYAIDQMGGWQGLCKRLTTDELHFRERDFARFFEIGERVASWEHDPGKVHVLPYLVGFYEVNNRSRGYALPAVKDAVTGRALPDMRRALGAGEEDVPIFLRTLAEGMRT